MNLQEIKDFFDVKDETHLFKDHGDIKSIQDQIARVKMPFFTGEREKEQATIVKGLTKAMGLTEKWASKASNLIHEFENLSSSIKEKCRIAFRRLKELEITNQKLAGDFLDRQE